MYNSPTYLFHSLEGGNLPNGRSLLSFLGYDTGSHSEHRWGFSSLWSSYTGAHYVAQPIKIKMDEEKSTLLNQNHFVN